MRKVKYFMIILEDGQVYFIYSSSIRRLKKEHKENNERLIFCKELSGALLPLGILASDYQSEFGQAMEAFISNIVKSITGK